MVASMEDNRNGVTDPRCIGVSVIVSASVNNIGHNEMKKEQRQKVSADSRINSKVMYTKLGTWKLQ